MRREGWRVVEGEFRPPTPREGPVGGGLSVEMLEREEPIKILSLDRAGRKRDRGEMEDGEVDD